MTDRLALWGLLSVALVISLITDLATRRILDAVTYPTAAVALAYRLFQLGVGDLETGFISGLVGALACAAIFALALRPWKGDGWGDVKLLFAVGAVFGYPLALSAAVFIALIGALQALVSLIWKGAVWSTLRSGLLKLTKRKTTSEKPNYIPYGVAIALGSFWAMWWERTQ